MHFAIGITNLLTAFRPQWHDIGGPIKLVARIGLDDRPGVGVGRGWARMRRVIGNLSGMKA